MPITETARPYPLIDADPHFGRVVRYMRPSDYAVWGGAAVAGPALLYMYGTSDVARTGKCSTWNADAAGWQRDLAGTGATEMNRTSKAVLEGG